MAVGEEFSACSLTTCMIPAPGIYDGTLKVDCMLMETKVRVLRGNAVNLYIYGV